MPGIAKGMLDRNLIFRIETQRCMNYAVSFRYISICHCFRRVSLWCYPSIQSSLFKLFHTPPIDSPSMLCFIWDDQDQSLF
mmetsp:Transcript_14883/g.17915  ORF Transcript_14883/g.17915 Transcript_14883/m.17915 type:complete len:81 (-) Transcript_14883:98-340(-)